jgi:hypothetical protein
MMGIRNWHRVPETVRNGEGFYWKVRPTADCTAWGEGEGG